MSFSSSGAERVERSIREHRERTFLIDSIGGEEFSYGRFHERACALAHGLERQGIRPQNRVALLLPNGTEFALAYFACFYLGATAVPVNPALSGREIRYILQNARADRVVVAPSTISSVQDGPDGLKLLCLIPRLEQGWRDEVPVGLEVDKLPPAPGYEPFSCFQERDVALIVYTSGTTARPKGIAHCLSGLVNNAMAFGQEHGIKPEHRFFLTLSMAYMGGFYNSLLLPFLHGASVVVDEVFGARSSVNFWQKPLAHQVNAFWLAPTILAILLKMDRGSDGERFFQDGKKRIFSGFGPLPLRVKQGFEQRYGVTVYETYGLSETLFVSSVSGRFASPEDSVGRPIRGVEIAILGEEDEVLGPGAEGEIAVKTPHRMAGYVDERGKVQAEEPTGWFRTGDYGKCTPDGDLFITGRKKEVIIRGGINVSPAAVEEVLRGFPGIADCAVVSTPHDLYGEEITAVLKLESGVELDLIRGDLAAYAHRNLAAHQQPARYLAITEFPMTPTGKIQKGLLRDLAIQKLQLVP